MRKSKAAHQSNSEDNFSLSHDIMRIAADQSNYYIITYIRSLIRLFVNFSKSCHSYNDSAQCCDETIQRSMHLKMPIGADLSQIPVPSVTSLTYIITSDCLFLAAASL